MSQINDKEKLYNENAVSEGAAANAAAPSSFDIDGDGKTSAADSRLVLRYANGYDDNLTDAQKGMLDFDNDGQVSDNDAKGVLRTAAQLPAEPVVTAPSPKIEAEKQTEEKSEVDALIEQYLNEYAAIKDFSYDPNNPLSQYYDRKYQNAAILNQQNALAAGGTGYNSTKQALANSAYNSTIDGLGDVQQQLYQMALDSYQQERSEALQNIELARALKQDKLSEDYQKWTIENTEKEQERNQSNIEADRKLNNASLSASYGNYDALSEITGLDFSNQENRDAFNDAYTMYQATGSLTGFKELGIDTSYLESERSKEQAILAASYGDYSGLKNLGIDTTKISKNEEIQFALYLAEYGDYSRLEDLLGGDLSNAAYANNLEIGITAAQAGDYSKLEEMGFDTTYIKKLNNLNLQTSSSGGSGGGSSQKTNKVQVINQDIIDSAADAYSFGESNLSYYLNQLYEKGFTEEQLKEILYRVVPEYELEDGSSIAQWAKVFAERMLG